MVPFPDLPGSDGLPAGVVEPQPVVRHVVVKEPGEQGFAPGSRRNSLGLYRRHRLVRQFQASGSRLSASGIFCRKRPGRAVRETAKKARDLLFGLFQVVLENCRNAFAHQGTMLLVGLAGARIVEEGATGRPGRTSRTQHGGGQNHGIAAGHAA